MICRFVQFNLPLVGLFGQLALPAARLQSPPRYDWLQFGGNAAHSNNNQREHAITRSSVTRLHLLFRVALPAISDGAAVCLHHVHTRRGILDPVFLSTIEGDTMALDGHTGATIWSHRYRDVPCSSTDSLGCEAHTTPAIEPNRRYVYAYALNGRVHKFAAGAGTETMSGGWPEMATAKPTQEKSAGALTIALSSTPPSGPTTDPAGPTSSSRTREVFWPSGCEWIARATSAWSMPAPYEHRAAAR